MPVAADLPVTLAPMPADSRLELTSPSQLEGGARVRVAQILDLTSSVATTRGTLIHALFEQVVWLDDGMPDALRLRRIAESLATCGLDVDEQLTAFQQHADHAGRQRGAAARVLRDAARSRVCNRRWQQPGPQHRCASLPTTSGGLPCATGRVCCPASWIAWCCSTMAIAWWPPTSSTTRPMLRTGTIVAQFDQLVEFYRPQLDAYRKAVATMFHLPPRQICAACCLSRLASCVPSNGTSVGNDE